MDDPSRACTDTHALPLKNHRVVAALGDGRETYIRSQTPLNGEFTGSLQYLVPTVLCDLVDYLTHLRWQAECL